MRRLAACLPPATILLLAIAACGGDTASPATPALTPTVQADVTPSPDASRPPAGPIECSLDLAQTQPDSVIYGAAAGDFLADRFSLASGDFNGDGRGDLIIGAPLADGPDNSRTGAGEAYVILGTASPPPVIDLAKTPPDLTIIGEAPGDNFGFTVASGDINGDGMDDMLVGARFAAADGRSHAGKVYAVFGHGDLGGVVDTSAGDQDLTLSGEDSGDFFGIALGSGDVDGDRIDDLIVGASAADGPEDDRNGAGAVYVLLGARSPQREVDLSEADRFFTIHGDRRDDALPNIVASGDLDGDGRAELILGAPFAESGDEDREDAGEVYIVSVPEDGGVLDLASGQGFTRITGADRRDGFGHYVASGDVNGDGSADAIIGARDADGRPGEEVNNAGEVHVLFGASDLTGRLDLAEDSLDATVYGTDVGDSLGFTVAAGDLDGDGTDELLAGAPLGDACRNAAEDAGEFYVFAGGSGLKGDIFPARGEFEISAFGAQAGDSLAFSLTTGDFNGDGKDDVIAGALLADGPEDSREDSGEVYIILSR